MSITTRPAVATDASRIAELLTQLGYPARADEVASRVAYWLGDRRSHLIVADTGGEVVGVAALHAFPLLEHTGWRGRLVALVVDEKCRGLGIGRQLVAAVEDAARECGCRDVEVTSSRRRSAAHAFYERLGYVDVCDTAARFLKPLSRAGAGVTTWRRPRTAGSPLSPRSRGRPSTPDRR